MLINELFNYRLNENTFSGDIEIQDAIDDIIVALRQQRIFQIKLDAIAGEVSKAVDGVQINPNEPEFLEQLSSSLVNNKWVSEVSNGVVKFKKSDEFDKNAGNDALSNRKKHDNKMNKMASKNLKKKYDSGEL